MKKKKNLTIEKLFSLLSNQKRLEILMAVLTTTTMPLKWQKLLVSTFQQLIGI